MAKKKQGEGYQGWANHATWAMALWINNEEGSYHESRRIIREAKAYFKYEEK